MPNEPRTLDERVVFVADPDPALAQRLVLWLACAGYRCEAFVTWAALAERLEQLEPHAICSLLWDDPLACDLWSRGRSPVLLVASPEQRDAAREAVIDGAFDWFDRPPNHERFITAVRNATALSLARISSPPARAHSNTPAPSGEPGDSIVPISEVERLAIIQAIQMTGGNISQAARELEVGRATLYRKLSLYGIDPSDLL